MKPKFIIVSLTSCSGCIVSLFSLEIIPQILDKLNLIYFPFIIDNTKIDENDIALIEGCVIDERQIDLLMEIRKKSKKIIALGTCAAFGGILSLSKEYDAEPISNYIEIDNFIPGCPPPTKLLGNSIIGLLDDKDIILSEKNMCISCPFRNEIGIDPKIEVNKLINPNVCLTDEEPQCFLKKGILCLGPIIREGCESKCIKFGMPCEGCMGPITQNYTSNLINFLSMVNLSKDLQKYDGLFYRFGKPKIKGGKI